MRGSNESGRFGVSMAGVAIIAVIAAAVAVTIGLYQASDRPGRG